jgi:tetratricopeptide (TPR) repeat protein
VEHAPTRPRPGSAVIALIVVAACGSAQRPGPSRSTLSTIEQAEAAALRRDHETARRLYLDAIAAAPDAPSQVYARHELAETLHTWGEYDGMATQLEAIVALAADDAAAWHDLGLVRHHLGDDAGARAALIRARDLARNDPRPRKSLAVLYWKLGDLPRALAEYRELQALDLPEREARAVEWAIRCLGDIGPDEAERLKCPKLAPPADPK